MNVGRYVRGEDLHVGTSRITKPKELKMNERLKELAEQAGFQKYFLGSGYIVRDQELERFAELVRQDERAKCASDYLQDCCDAVDAARLDEREACALLCEEWYLSGDVAKAIRARGKK